MTETEIQRRVRLNRNNALLTRKQRTLPYNPWKDKKRIGSLLRYGLNDSKAFQGLIWHQRYGVKRKDSVRGRGCPYCALSARSVPIMQHPVLPYRCRGCGKLISALLDTPMFRSQITVPVWFDCLYLIMGGYSKEAPVFIAMKYDTPALMQRYNLTKQKADKLKWGCRQMVLPLLSGLWGDEPKGMAVRETDKAKFDALLEAVCRPTRLKTS